MRKLGKLGEFSNEARIFSTHLTARGGVRLSQFPTLPEDTILIAQFDRFIYTELWLIENQQDMDQVNGAADGGGGFAAYYAVEKTWLEFVDVKLITHKRDAEGLPLLDEVQKQEDIDGKE